MNNSGSFLQFVPIQTINRNAYEIRESVLKMAIDWSIYSDKNKLSPKEVIDVAKEFYSFVEQRRY